MKLSGLVASLGALEFPMLLGVGGLQCTKAGKLLGREGWRLRRFASLASGANVASLAGCQRRTIFSQTSLYKYFTEKTPPEWSSFDREWDQATEAQKESIREHYDALQRGNWKDLTLEQMRNCYTVGYGAPDSPILERRDKILVFIGTACAVGTGVGLYGFLRLFGKCNVFIYWCFSLA